MTAAIEVLDLRFRYPDGTEALRGANFSVAEKKCVGLIGPNGAGKSTLLLHLNGILPDTRIIATHDLELVVELCSRVMVLDRGLIIADGSAADLLSNDELMRRHGLETPHILRHAHPHGRR